MLTQNKRKRILLAPTLLLFSVFVLGFQGCSERLQGDSHSSLSLQVNDSHSSDSEISPTNPTSKDPTDATVNLSDKIGFGPTDFVMRSGNQFLLHGKRFRFTSSTYPFLMHFAAFRKADDASDPYAAYIDEVFRQQQAIGTKVLRIWADPEVQGAGWGRAVGYTRQQIDQLIEDYRSALDFVISKAEEHQIRLILVLYHPWPVTSQAPRAFNYEMLMRCSPENAVSANSVNSVEFFKNANCVQVYMEMITKIFLRKNTYKGGLEYRSDPTILSWELMTEPANYGTGANSADWIVRNWIESVSLNVRINLKPKQMLTVSIYADDLPANRFYYPQTSALTPSQLLAVFSGSAPRTSMNDIFQIASIDYADIHLYLGEQANIPFWSGLTNSQGSVFLYEIASRAKLLGKPLVVSEFGVTARTLPSGCSVASSTCPWIQKSSPLLEKQMSEVLGYGYAADVDGMITWHVEIDPTELNRRFPSVWKSNFEAFYNVDWNAIYLNSQELSNPYSPAKRWLDWTYAFSNTK